QMEELCLFGCSAGRCTTGRRTDCINNSFHMTRHIGSTTYKVTVFLAEDGSETMAGKILRMMQNEVLESKATCDILDLSQTSLQSGRSA
ncbi:MAG: transposon-encoded TnpW family protein, partial [Clostridiales bacterium]|nr:transposon-encoded TnpW family protein [Clostridiales bacterium]